jgi:hypothetical protein
MCINEDTRNVKKLNMLSHLRNLNIIFCPFHIINLQLYLWLHKVNKSEGALGKRLQKTIVHPPKKYFMEGTIHLFIVEHIALYEITYMP